MGQFFNIPKISSPCKITMKGAIVESNTPPLSSTVEQPLAYQDFTPLQEPRFKVHWMDEEEDDEFYLHDDTIPVDPDEFDDWDVVEAYRTGNTIEVEGDDTMGKSRNPMGQNLFPEKRDLKIMTVEEATKRHIKSIVDEAQKEGYTGKILSSGMPEYKAVKLYPKYEFMKGVPHVKQAERTQHGYYIPVKDIGADYEYTNVVCGDPRLEQNIYREKPTKIFRVRGAQDPEAQQNQGGNNMSVFNKGTGNTNVATPKVFVGGAAARKNIVTTTNEISNVSVPKRPAIGGTGIGRTGIRGSRVIGSEGSTTIVEKGNAIIARPNTNRVVGSEPVVNTPARLNTVSRTISSTPVGTYDIEAIKDRVKKLYPVFMECDMSIDEAQAYNELIELLGLGEHGEPTTMSASVEISLGEIEDSGLIPRAPEAVQVLYDSAVQLYQAGVTDKLDKIHRNILQGLVNARLLNGSETHMPETVRFLTGSSVGSTVNGLAKKPLMRSRNIHGGGILAGARGNGILAGGAGILGGARNGIVMGAGARKFAEAGTLRGNVLGQTAYQRTGSIYDTVGTSQGVTGTVTARNHYGTVVRGAVDPSLIGGPNNGIAGAITPKADPAITVRTKAVGRTPNIPDIVKRQPAVGASVNTSRIAAGNPDVTPIVNNNLVTVPANGSLLKRADKFEPTDMGGVTTLTKPVLRQQAGLIR